MLEYSRNFIFSTSSTNGQCHKSPRLLMITSSCFEYTSIKIEPSDSMHILSFVFLITAYFLPTYGSLLFGLQSLQQLYLCMSCNDFPTFNVSLWLSIPAIPPAKYWESSSERPFIQLNLVTLISYQRYRGQSSVKSLETHIDRH